MKRILLAIAALALLTTGVIGCHAEGDVHGATHINVAR